MTIAIAHTANHGSSRRERRKRHGRAVVSLMAVLLTFALIAAACGSSSTTDESGTDSEETGTDSEEEEDTTTADRDAGEASGEDDRVTETGPTSGGKLVYGIEADSANPWTHYATSCAISCRMILRAITDSLFLADSEGNLVPNLVVPGSVQASDDYKQWSFDVRDGISFHDGTPFDGAAVAYNFNTCRKSPLTAAAFLGMDDVSADGQTVTITYGTSEAVGPTVWRAETCGQMLSPTWLATLANNPLHTPEQREAAEGDPSAPVGLGAFKFVSYTPGNGNSFIAERNPDYWRGPNGITGENLPYLDEIELVVAVDIQGRSNGLKGGQFDIIHTANSDEIAKFLNDEEFVVLEANEYGETNYALLNVAQGPNPTLSFLRGSDVVMDPLSLNASNPLVHLSCRKALAHALDRERFAEERGAGIVTPANGPFPPGSVGYLADSGYPDFDLEAAATEWESCKTDSGQNPVTFSYNTTNDAFNVESNELVVSMWVEAFGDEINVSIMPIEQGQYIGLALAGVFQAQGWRNHGGVDPTEQWYWWHSATASPINPSVPELALNFGRFQDPAIDTAIGVIRSNPDPDARREAAEALNRSFGENVWNLWTFWTLWGVIANPRVQNLTELPIPGHSLPTTPVIAGKHHLAQIWCTDGDCQG